MENGYESLTIGAFAKAAGVNVETIRFYQRKGLLLEPEKPYGSIRRYGEADVTRVRFVKSAQWLGFSLDEIRALLDLGGPGKASCADVRNVATRHLDDIRAKIDDLKKLERLLAKTIAQCSGKKVPDCPVLDILDVERFRLSPK